MNALYDNAAYAMQTGNFDWVGWNLIVSAWDGVPSFFASHNTIAAIKLAGFNELGTSLLITEKTVTTTGIAQTNNVIIPGITAGNEVTWFTVARQQATHDNSTLICFIDDAEGLPFTANGLDVELDPDWLMSRGWYRP